MSELIVRELRLRAFARVTRAVPLPPAAADSTARVETACHEVAQRLVVRHSRRRSTPGELAL